MNNLLIFKSILNANPDLNYKDYMKITGKAENTIFYWLRFERSPDNLSLLLIKTALELDNRKVPVRLEKLINKIEQQPIDWVINDN